MTEVGMRLAIVGSTSLEGNQRAARIIERLLDAYLPAVVISGGAVGIDQMAAAAARARDIPVVEHLPEVPEWERGYKPRNLKIAQDCTHLVRIVAKDARTYGSGWTRDQAKRLGRMVAEYTI